MEPMLTTQAKDMLSVSITEVLLDKGVSDATSQKVAEQIVNNFNARMVKFWTDIQLSIIREVITSADLN